MSENPNEVKTFQLTVAEIAVLGRALGKLPFEEVVGVIGNIQRQLQPEPKTAALKK